MSIMIFICDVNAPFKGVFGGRESTRKLKDPLKGFIIRRPTASMLTFCKRKKENCLISGLSALSIYFLCLSFSSTKNVKCKVGLLQLQ